MILPPKARSCSNVTLTSEGMRQYQQPHQLPAFPQSPNPPSRIIRGALRGDFSLVIVETTLGELAQKVQSKRYLVDRISAENVEQLVDSLRAVAEVYPLPSDPLPRVVRDPRDDYLLTPAVLAKVDFVVSGDKDLLVLDEFSGVRMVTPADFVRILDESL